MKVGAMILARSKSERLPGKLLAHVGNKTVIEWALRSAAMACDRVGVELMLGVRVPSEPVMVNFAQRLGIDIFERDYVSSGGETMETVYNRWFVEELPPDWDSMVIINPCFPFLLADTTARFLHYVQHHKPANILAVRETREIVFKQTLPLSSPGLINTKINKSQYTPAHCLSAYTVEDIGTPAMLDYTDFWVVPRQLGTVLDINDALDLRIADAVASNLQDHASVFMAGPLPWHSNSETTKSDTPADESGLLGPALP